MNINLLFLFLAYLSLTTSAPIDRNPKQNGCDGKPAEKTCPAQPCFFSKLHKATWETKPRPEKSVVSSVCSGKIIKIGDLLSYSINEKTGEANAVELLLCRGTGQCDIDLSKPENQEKWKNVEICDHHADELLRKWDDSHSTFRNNHIYYGKVSLTTSKVCSMPEEVGRKHKTRPHDHLLPLKLQEADTIGKEMGILVHPGIPVCESHRRFIKELVKEKISNPPKKLKIDQSPSMNTEDEVCSSDPDFIPRESIPRSPAAAALLQFAKCTNVHRVCFPHVSYPELRDSTKERKACGVKKMFLAMLGIVSPGDTEDLEKRVLGKITDDLSWTTGSSKNFESIMQQVAAQFFAAEVRTSRLIVLSLVSNSVSYLEVVKYIPNLSRYMYDSARRFARRNHNAEMPPKKLERYNPLALQCFVEFITSPTIMIGLPFGTRKVKLADGSKLEIPNSIRQQSSSEIFDMYSNYLEETQQKHLALSKSTIFRILEVCAATNRVATTCVDYFIANGMEAFEGLHGIIDGWIAEDLADSTTMKELKTALHEAAQYLRTDYRLHVKNFSRVADHCANYALSDPNDPKMASSCSTGPNRHRHDLKCDRCELVTGTMEKMRIYADSFVRDAKEAGSSVKDKETLLKRKEESYLIAQYTDHVFEMKKHMLRAAFTSEERSDMIEALQDNQALITLDFAQKYLPRWHRESQGKYFGKKGMSYHIAHVAARIGEKMSQHSHVHIYNQEAPQDSGLVVFTIAHIAKELKKVGINRISLRSDNAGAYHCASTITALYWLNETTGVTFDTYTFSEAQNGKSSSDREANRVKRKAENFVAKGNDIATTDQFFAALKADKPLNGASIHHGTVSVQKIGDSKWPGISNLNHFTLEKNGIRGRRYGSIGEGQLMPKSSLKPPTGSYKFEEAGFVTSRIVSIDAERNAVMNGLKTNFWYYSECAKTSISSADTCVKEQDDVTPELDLTVIENNDAIGTLFACPEPGCSSTFFKLWNLEKHILKGQHKISPEKMTSRDFSLKLFVRKLEEVEKTRMCPIVEDAIKELKETSEETKLKQGWALPKKQKRKPFEEDVKKFLIECFDEGLKSGKRLNPMTVAKRMISEKKSDGSLRFSVEERKDFQQIAGFFSREAEKRRSAKVSRVKRNNAEAYKDEYVVPEEEHDDAGYIRFLKDEETWTTGDEFYNAIMTSEDPVFVYS